MNSYPFEDGVVFLQFQAVGRVFPVLLGNVPGSARHAGVPMLSAFQDDLNAVSFALLSHLS